MKNIAQKTIRRSIALPNELVEELRTVAPPELRDNFNRLVTFILIDFTRRQKKYQFETAMVEMADDPAIRKVCSVMSEEFMVAENDGL
jgi:hypothetical protein